jgi:hypothetical protein
VFKKRNEVSAGFGRPGVANFADQIGADQLLIAL